MKNLGIMKEFNEQVKHSVLSHLKQLKENEQYKNIHNIYLENFDSIDLLLILNIC